MTSRGTRCVTLAAAIVRCKFVRSWTTSATLERQVPEKLEAPSSANIASGFRIPTWLPPDGLVIDASSKLKFGSRPLLQRATKMVIDGQGLQGVTPHEF